jgi:hypothetical protein
MFYPQIEDWKHLSFPVSQDEDDLIADGSKESKQESMDRD